MDEYKLNSINGLYRQAVFAIITFNCLVKSFIKQYLFII